MLRELEKVDSSIAQFSSAHKASVVELSEIAQALSISEFTVKRHMQNILHKLDLPSRTAAGLFYRSAFESAGTLEMEKTA